MIRRVILEFRKIKTLNVSISESIKDKWFYRMFNV